MSTELKRKTAFVIGAPFFVSASYESLQERFVATGFNTGNLLIGDGLTRLLDMDIVKAGGPDSLSRIDEVADHLVIPAANFLSPKTDISWLLPAIERSTIPITMIGVGAQFPTDSLSDAVLPEATLQVMRRIAERSACIGVRGAFTADLLRKHGIHNVEVTGCPSMFRSGLASMRVRQFGRLDSSMVFNGSINVTGHASSKDAAVAVESAILRAAMKTDGAYVLQNEMAEMGLCSGDESQGVMDGCRQNYDGLDRSFTFVEYCAYMATHGKVFFDLPTWEAFIGSSHGVIGTRFHGNVMALSQGVPALFVVHDSRTRELCDALFVPYVTLADFRSKPLEDLLARTSFSAFEQGYPLARDRLAGVLDRNGLPHRLRSGAAFLPNEALTDLIEADRVHFAVQPEFDDPVDGIKHALSLHRTKTALEIYDQMESAHPKFLGVSQLLAQSVLSQRAIDAIRVCDRGLTCFASDSKLMWLKARALAVSEQWQLASQVAREALRNVDGMPLEWVNELRLLEQQRPTQV